MFHPAKHLRGCVFVCVCVCVCVQARERESGHVCIFWLLCTSQVSFKKYSSSMTNPWNQTVALEPCVWPLCNLEQAM